MSEWQPIETADLHKLFGFAERVLLATSDGRVTQAAAHFISTHGFVWSCAYGNNVADPRHPSEYLKHRATHWMPLPEPPQLELHEELDDKNEALHTELAELYGQIHELRSNRAAQHSDLAEIKTWEQRCEEQHLDHEIVTDGMIQSRMKEEIADLRGALRSNRAAIAGHLERLLDEYKAYPDSEVMMLCTAERGAKGVTLGQLRRSLNGGDQYGGMEDAYRAEWKDTINQPQESDHG